MERFYSKILIDEGGCWKWTASLTKQGYGRFRIEGETRLAHRISYILHVGDIPKGLVLDHLCRNRACVNPDHLEPVTSGENSRRGETGAHHAQKTHCPRGHEYSGANLHVYKGARVCRACAYKAHRRHMDKVGG